ncbi:hypothetical protein BJ912DRAFT_961451, partial [Pholiota molesta]
SYALGTELLLCLAGLIWGRWTFKKGDNPARYYFWNHQARYAVTGYRRPQRVWQNALTRYASAFRPTLYEHATLRPPPRWKGI